MSALLSPCIEWLFADGGRPFDDRVRAAAEAGFERVEFWTTSSKDVDRLERSIAETGIRVTAFVSEPTARLVDPSTHDLFIEGVRRSAETAARLRAEGLIVVSGDALDGVDESKQSASVAAALRRAAPIAAQHELRLLLEPLNTRVDHKGYFLHSTRDAFDIVREVDHPAVRVLYDLYHSAVMGESTAEVLAGNGHLVGHVHVADAPGRHEPGSGTIDWAVDLAAIRSAGYQGPIGLEYMPLQDTGSGLDAVRRIMGEPAR
jgi:hydroxypyruvate isomerase